MVVVHHVRNASNVDITATTKLITDVVAVVLVEVPHLELAVERPT